MAVTESGTTSVSRKFAASSVDFVFSSFVESTGALNDVGESGLSSAGTEPEATCSTLR